MTFRRPPLAAIWRPLSAALVFAYISLVAGMSHAALPDDIRKALAEDRPEAALSLLDQSGPAAFSDPVEFHFLRGLALIEAGRADEAVEIFEDLVARMPRYTRIRLELARAYFEAGRDESAERQFQQVLGGRLPPEVRQTIYGFLNEIRKRRTWSGNFRMGIAPDTNISGGSTRDTVTIFGQEFILSDDAKKSSGVGLEVTGDVQRLFLSTTRRTRPALGVNFAIRDYPNQEFDDISLGGFAGIQHRLDDGSVTIGPRYTRRWYGGQPYTDTYGLQVRGEHRLGERLFGSGSIFVGERARLNASNRDRRSLVNASASLYRPVGPSSAVGIAAFGGREMAEADWNSLWQLGGQLSLSHEFPYGFRVLVQPGVIFEWRDDDHPLFGAPEDRVTYRADFSVTNRLIAYRGFSPYLGLQLSHQDSDVALHEHDRARLLVGIEQSF